MLPRRLLYAAEFGLRLLAAFLPRHRSKLRRASWAVRGYGGLIVTALAIHQAQVAGHHRHAGDDHFISRHYAVYPSAAYPYPYGRGDRRIKRSSDPCPWSADYPYRSCTPDPFH